jgi:metallo-beta-lactamase class B
MKRSILGIGLLLLPFFAHAQLAVDTPKLCTNCEGWNKPQAPFRVFGNTWYVGTAGLSAILVVTDDGLILLDGALAQSASLIHENIRQLGFDTRDIKIILNSHPHFDHAGGINALQRHSQAKVVAGTGAIEALRTGEVPSTDPQFAFGPDANSFPAIANVSLIEDKASIELGGTVLTAHYTPGHTPGGTSWTWQSCEGDRCLNVVYADSLSAVSAEGFKFSGPNGPSVAAEQITTSTQIIGNMDCDVLLSPHPFLFKMAGKLETRLTNPQAQPFIESDACLEYSKYFQDWLKKRLEEEIP